MTESEINGLASGFLEWMIADLEHEFLYTGRVIGTVLESHVTKEPTIVKFIDGTPREYPTGTWFVTVKITDQDVIQGIKNEHYTGVSATTIERKDAEKLKKLLNSGFNVSTKSRIKRILISDIQDPVVVTISVVHSPCVPTAKFCSLKSKRKVSDMSKNIDEQIEAETKGFINRLGEIFGSTKSDKVKDEEKDDDGSKKQPDFITAADFDDFKSEIIELVTAMNDKVNEVVKASAKSDDESDEEPAGLTPEEEKELERLLAKKEASTKSDEEKKDDDDEEEDDDEDEIKASSKSTPVHDTGKKTKPQLSDSAIVYGIMGRDNTGSTKRN